MSSIKVSLDTGVVIRRRTMESAGLGSMFDCLRLPMLIGTLSHEKVFIL